MKHLPLIPLLFAVLASRGGAQPTCADIWNLVGSGGPSWRYSTAMAADTGRWVVVLFGGFSTGVGFVSDTWEWNGAAWSQRSPATIPPRRALHALAYDAARSRTVMYGGRSTGPTLSDTWEWDGTNWTEIVAGGPGPRSGHAMAYDLVRRKTVLYGGGNGQTWEWDGTTWTLASSAGPGSRTLHAMAYDPDRARIVLFGGQGGGGPMGDTWEWDGVAWTQVATTGPPATDGHALAFDAACRKVVLYGSADGRTWFWNGSAWFSMPAGLGLRRDHAMAFDPMRSRVILFGGRLPGQMVGFNDLWEWCCPCDDEAARVNAQGEPVLPRETEPGSVVDEQIEEDRGFVSEIYSAFDTRTDTWYREFPCEPSTGGTIPPQASNPNLQQQLIDAGIVGVTPQEVYDSLKQWEDLMESVAQNEVNRFTTSDRVAGPYTAPAEPACTSPLEDYVFGGRDIVFVHGLKLEHIGRRLQPSPPARWQFPGPPNYNGWTLNPDYYNAGGYYRDVATGNWQDHIQRFLTDRGMKNRYLVVAYPCDERLEVGASAILTQIADAMRTGRNVVDPLNPNGPAPTNFGTPSFVVITHSTGGIATSVAMAAAALHPNLGAAYIPQHCKAHIAIQGAFSGSRLATAAIALSGYIALVAPTWLCPLAVLGLGILNETGGPLPACPALFTTFANSVLVDLVPIITQLKWGVAYRDQSPVRTLTLVGGHPTVLAPLKYILHPGLDDGVLTINSQVANPESTLFWPSGFLPNPPGPIGLARTFDMGLFLKRSQPIRAVGYFVDQRIDPLLNPLFLLANPLGVAAGATPYVSPTGMVQPVFLKYPSPFDSLRRAPNHFSFLQSAADHFRGARVFVDYPDYRPSFGEACDEETRVITDPAVYTPYPNPVYSGPPWNIDGQSLLTESKVPRLKEIVRGRKVRFRIFGQNKTWWVWKRRYHVLDGWQITHQLDYVYRSVLSERVNDCIPDPRFPGHAGGGIPITATPARLGQVFCVSFTSPFPPPPASLLLMSAVRSQIPLPPPALCEPGDLWAFPPLFILSGATNPASYCFGIPAEPSLPGVVLYFQGAMFNPPLGCFRLTDAVQVTIRQ